MSRPDRRTRRGEAARSPGGAGAGRPTARGASRRDLLRAAGGLVGAGWLVPAALARALAPAPPPQLAPDAPLPGARRTRRLVLVIFGGGVRTRETLDSDNVPYLTQLAEEGVVFPDTAVENVGHYGAALSILTGRFEYRGIRENERGTHPTLFELVREHTGLPASEVWLSTSGDSQDRNFAYSDDPRYGSRYGANLLAGEGLFNVELRQMLGGALASRRDPVQEDLLARLRGAVRPGREVLDGHGLENDPQTTARVERYILDELRGGISEVSGTGANDVKAIRVARNLLSIFRPRLLVISLRAADVAHGSYNEYVEVVRRNDRELGRLYEAVRENAELADSTGIVVLPEFGRDRDLNARRGLDHGDGSTDLLRVATVAWGPDFERGRVDTRRIASIDVAPTLLSMFGVRPGRSVRGRVLEEMMA